MREEHLEVPMKVVQASGASDVTIGKTGSGRVYYRIGMRYAPKDLALPPIDRGFVVTRTYEPASKGDAVTRDPSGAWRIKAGQTQDIITYTGAMNESGTFIKGRFSMTGKGGRFTASKQ